MERRYYRQYDAYDNVFPRPEDFPPVYRAGVGVKDTEEIKQETEVKSVSNNTGISLKADDIILLGLIVILLMEEQKDYLTIGILAAIFLCEYLF